MKTGSLGSAVVPARNKWTGIKTEHVDRCAPAARTAETQLRAGILEADPHRFWIAKGKPQ
jgi:hypothetical protein